VFRVLLLHPLQNQGIIDFGTGQPINVHHLWCVCEKGSILETLQQLLLSQAAARFDPGSGTPKPHTSTSQHVHLPFKWSNFS
jgi:hypothetical protein